MNIVCEPDPRLERTVKRITIASVRDIILGIYAARRPARIGAERRGNSRRRDVFVVVCVLFVIPPKTEIDSPVVVRLPLVLNVQADLCVLAIVSSRRLDVNLCLDRL